MNRKTSPKRALMLERISPRRAKRRKSTPSPSRSSMKTRSKRSRIWPRRGKTRAEDIAEERADVQEAAADLRTEQQKLQATQARDAYVKDAEAQLAAMKGSVEQLKTQSDNGE